MIRAARPTDVVALAGFLSQTCAVDRTAPVWPQVEADSGRLTLVPLLAESLLNPAPRRRAWLLLRHGRVEGLIVARVRARGMVWVVERLVVDASADSVGERLLEHVAARATAHDARRIFFHVPLQPDAQSVALRAGFRRFTADWQYLLTPPLPSVPRQDWVPRQRLGSDDHALFKLYNLAVPLNVRSAEAMTCDEWVALHHGSHRWSGSLFGAQEDFVWQSNDTLAALMEWRVGRRSQHFTLLVHPNYRSLVESLLYFVMGQARDRLPLYGTVREYQPEIGSALERLGFLTVGEAEVWVRQLASRVAKPRLVAANVAGRC